MWQGAENAVFLGVYTPKIFSFMIFTPENRKKIEDATVVQYKGKYGNFEIVAVPNKLYEYKRDTKMGLDEVLQSRSIFADASKGKQARTEEIQKEFGGGREEALRIILEQGSEKKDKATREYEFEVSRRKIVEGVMSRVRTVDGRRMSANNVEELLKKIAYAMSGRPEKVQVSEIAKKAVKHGYKRKVLKMKISKAIDLSGVVLGEGSHCAVKNSVVEATDDLYGQIHRIADEEGALIEELPEEEAEAVEI